jgi:hypothetical protein
MRNTPKGILQEEVSPVGIEIVPRQAAGARQNAATVLGNQARARRRLFRLPARNVEIGELFDTYIACAVATIVLLRVYLELTGYPKLGGNGLHIAHVLWGGLAMTLAIGILTGFISRRTRQLGAIVGGIGFGMFIDELGKFVTSDNDYFFRPSAVLMYGVFVVLVLVARLLRRGGRFTREEKMANVIELLKEAAIGDLDRHEHARARLLLEECGATEPWARKLHELVREAERRDPRPSLPGRGMAWLRQRSMAALEKRWLLWTLASVYTLQALVTFLLVLMLAVLAGVLRDSDLSDVELTSWLSLGASFVSSLAALAGAVMLWRSRRAGLLVLEVAVLIDLFLVQPFSLLESQFAALVGVFIDLALLVVIRHLAGRDRALERQQRLSISEGV